MDSPNNRDKHMYWEFMGSDLIDHLSFLLAINIVQTSCHVWLQVGHSSKVKYIKISISETQP